MNVDIENRVRLVRIPQQQVLDWFANAVEGWPSQIQLPVSLGLPKGAKVVSVHHEYMNRCFLFEVFHESFSPVPEGEMIPHFVDPMKMEYRSIPVPDDLLKPTIIEDEFAGNPDDH